MSAINCTIFCHSNSEHLQIIYTGFKLLEAQRRIKLRYKVIKNPPYPLPTLSTVELLVEIDGKKQLLFDLGDFGEV